MERRRLILKIVDENNVRTNFIVAEQSHRYTKFTTDVGRGTQLFTCKLDGYGECMIGSYQFPAALDIEDGYYRLCVRGIMKERDFITVSMRRSEFYNIVCPTVLAYNQKHSRNKLVLSDVIWD